MLERALAGSPPCSFAEESRRTRCWGELWERPRERKLRAPLDNDPTADCEREGEMRRPRDPRNPFEANTKLSSLRGRTT